jgi:hypothetical protein
VIETHPKAVLRALEGELWALHPEAISTTLTLGSKPDRERALIFAIPACQGFEGRWERDLIDYRYPSEQDPSTHWLASVHYFWPP